MERFTISMEDELALQFDEYVKTRGYSNRSEALRDIIRDRLENVRLTHDENGFCIATLSYVYNHHESELAGRITSIHHNHHELTHSTMHIHLDHDNCLETVILNGPVKKIQEFSDTIKASRGVRHGHLHMIPVEVSESAHSVDGIRHSHNKPTT
jgi:CopG family nickel-responsive transcriptional regulator